MTKPLPIIKNKAGKWIDRKTGKFVSKAVYAPYAEKQEKANLARSASSKEYWQDVKKIQEITGYDLEHARKTVSTSPKWLAKRGKKPFQWSQFWKDVKKQKLDKQARSNYKNKLEDEDLELVSY